MYLWLYISIYFHNLITPIQNKSSPLYPQELFAHKTLFAINSVFFANREIRIAQKQNFQTMFLAKLFLASFIAAGNPDDFRI